MALLPVQAFKNSKTKRLKTTCPEGGKVKHHLHTADIKAGVRPGSSPLARRPATFCPEKA